MYRFYLVLVTIFLLAGCLHNSEEKPAPLKDKDEIKINEEESNEEETNEEETDVNYLINESNWSLSKTDHSSEKIVLLTIDDAPDKYAVEMAEILKGMDVNAIFFVNGHFLETEEEKNKLKKIHDMGFMIGNHTYSHQNLQTLSETEQKKEIMTVNQQIEDITGEKPVFFRAPFGQNTDYSKQLVKDENMVLMNWTYGYDWNEEFMDADALIEIMLNTELLNDGANLLMHDREWTKNALKDIVIGLEEKDYKIVDPYLIKVD